MGLSDSIGGDNVTHHEQAVAVRVGSGQLPRGHRNVDIGSANMRE